MSLEQYKDATRKELWEVLQIQMGYMTGLEEALRNLLDVTAWIDSGDKRLPIAENEARKALGEKNDG